MAISVVQLIIPLSTPATIPFTTEVSLSQPYLREIMIAVPTAKLGLVGLRFYTENQLLAPGIGVGLFPWIVPLATNAFIWEEFKKLIGPPYKIQIEAYNTDVANQTCYVSFTTHHFNYLPVNMMNASHDFKGQLKADPSKNESAV